MLDGAMVAITLVVANVVPRGAKGPGDEEAETRDKAMGQQPVW